MKSACYLISLLCMLLNISVCNAQVVGSSSGFCLAANQNTYSRPGCDDSIDASSAYEELRSRIWGGLIHHIWKSSRKRHEKSRLQDDNELEANQKEDAWKKMLREADYDLRASSNRLVMTMKLHF